MKHTELKIGEIYYTLYEGKFSSIFRFKREQGDFALHTTSTKVSPSCRMAVEDKNHQIREATQEEKEWFERCEKAGMYLEPETILSYEIF